MVFKTDLLDVDKVLNFLHVSSLRFILFIWEEVVYLIVHYYYYYQL